MEKEPINELNLCLSCKITAFLLCLALLSANAHSQCIYDVDGDNIVTSDDYFAIINYYGLSQTDLEEGEELSTDFNNNGACEIEDFIEFLPQLANNDCWNLIENCDGIGEIVITQHHVHETTLTDNGNVIPAGSITYRMYVTVTNPDWHLNAIYGNAVKPMYINSNSNFFQFQLPLGIPLWDGTPQYTSDGLLSVFPSLAYNSWLTLNWNPVIPNSEWINFVDSPTDDWRDQFLNQNDIAINDFIGSGLLRPFEQYPSNAAYPNLFLLGQFTTDSMGIEGVINLSFHSSPQNDHIDIALKTLYFDNENIEILGCTDSLSMNYNPSASFDDGTCFPPGDFTGDGEVTLEDLMVLIGQFGCPVDCEGGDINNDGMVNIADVIAFLAFI
jgi:hypothetical protein